MKKFVLVLAFFLCAPLALLAQQGAPEIPFDSVPNALKLPAGMYLGEVSGVAVNSKGHIFIFSRGNTTGPAYAASAAQLLEFDKDGKFIREIGHNLYAWSFAHTVRIDKDDNIWAADKGSDMVIKFNPEGQVIMVFGRKQEASDEGTEPLKHPKPPLPPVDGMFRQVTDMAWDAAGDTFISDGYINSRVAKYDKNGKWMKSFGEPGSGPGQLNTPHSIATDSAGERVRREPRQFADRSVRRRRQIPPPNQDQRAVRLCEYGPDPRQQAARGFGGNHGDPARPGPSASRPGRIKCCMRRTHSPGRVYKISLDGKVLGKLGGTGRQLKQFGWIHEIACPSENEIYVGELLNWRMQKLMLHPAK